MELLIGYQLPIDVCDDKGWSPLHASCKTGHKDVVELLLKAGADVEGRTSDDVTPLYISAYGGHAKVWRKSECIN